MSMQFTRMIRLMALASLAVLACPETRAAVTNIVRVTGPNTFGFSPSNNVVTFQTYSPWTGEYNTDPGSELRLASLRGRVTVSCARSTRSEQENKKSKIAFFIGINFKGN